MKKIGKHEILGEIGEGGMGIVYKAKQEGLERVVALKVLLPNLSRKESFVERFMREARNAAALDHPNIVTIYDVGQDAGSYYFSMKFVEGEDLSDILKKGPIPLEKAVSIIGQVAQGIDHAHKKGIIHRDIKPANIIIDKSGDAIITDFGIARAAWETKLTTTGMTVGTVEYMSPEQFEGEKELDARSDIYSLGATFYMMVTGRSPFPGETTQKVIYKKMEGDPPDPSLVNTKLPGWIDDVISKAMARERGDRFSSAAEFADALKAGIEGKPAVVKRKKPPPSGAKTMVKEGPAREKAASLRDAGTVVGEKPSSAMPPIVRNGLIFGFVFLLVAGFLALLTVGIIKTYSFLSGGSSGKDGVTEESKTPVVKVAECGEVLNTDLIKKLFGNRMNEDELNYDLKNVVFKEGFFTGREKNEAIVSFSDNNQCHAAGWGEVWLFSCDGGWKIVSKIDEADGCIFAVEDLNNDGISEIFIISNSYYQGYGYTNYTLISILHGDKRKVFSTSGEDDTGALPENPKKITHEFFFEDYDGDGIKELRDLKLVESFTVSSNYELVYSDSHSETSYHRLIIGGGGAIIGTEKFDKN